MSDVNNNPPSANSLQSEVELVYKFKQLLTDVKGNLEVLHKYDDILSGEIESASSAGSSDDNETGSISPSPKDVNQFVEYRDEFIAQDVIKPLDSELKDMFTTRHRKYSWLSKFNVPYKFGGISHAAVQILNFENVVKLMDKLNQEYDLELDSCLVARYTTKQQALSPHQDNEDIIDQCSPICNVSIGPTRIIEFTKDDTKVLEYKMENGSLLKMNPGCQSELSHNVLAGEDDSEVRYALSFRKLNPVFLPNCSNPVLTHSPPNVPMSPVHPLHRSRSSVDQL